jgi:hypothetical protein
MSDKPITTLEKLRENIRKSETTNDPDISEDILLIREALQETANDTVFGTPEHERQLFALEALARIERKTNGRI